MSAPLDPSAPQSALGQVLLFDEFLPRRPYCADDLSRGLKIRPAATARRHRYIQANPPHLRVHVIYDIDRSGAAVAWEDADLPPPTWSAVNPENGHAHLAFSLDAPVLVADHARNAPVRYLCAVESAMRDRLQADRGYSGLVTKNPAHPHWRVNWGWYSYDLDTLGEYLPGIEKHIPRGRPELSGVGRNVDTFDWLRKYAYREIRLWWGVQDRQGIFVHWQNHLYVKAQEFTGTEHPQPLSPGESYAIAKSVARWVWRRFTEEAFRRRQSAVGKKGAAKGGRVSGEARRRGTPLETDRTPWVIEGVSRATWYRRRKA